MCQYLFDSLELDRQEKINRWVSEFPEGEQKKIAKHLKDSANKKEFENELAIGHLLKKAGFNLTYEPNIEGSTPDFYVNQNINYPNFIVEVRTLNSQQSLEVLEKKYEELKNKISELKFPYTLKIQYQHFIDDDMVTPFIHTDKILDELTQWLSTFERKDDCIVIDDFMFKIIKENQDSKLKIIDSSSSIGYKFQEGRFISAINDKKNKYKQLIENKQIPYVIGIFNEFSSRIELDQIKSIFCGANILFYNGEQLTLNITPKISADDIRSVSGILIFEYSSNRWLINYYDNSEYCSYKLPNNIFEKLLSFNGVPDNSIEDYVNGNYKVESFDEVYDNL